MNITTKEDGIRVICEHSYLTWYQQKNPTFMSILTKINHECNVDKKHIEQVYTEMGPIYTYNLHGIGIEIQHSNNCIQTTISYGYAKQRWITMLEGDDLYIPYFNDLLINIRDMWKQIHP